MHIVGLDIGYGFVKAKTGERDVVFPSVVGDVVQADFGNDLVTAGAGRTIAVDGRRWFYGRHAQKHSRNPLILFSRERTEQRDIMRVLLCAAIAELGIDGRISLCTGLPVGWFADRDDLEGILKGRHDFVVDDRPTSVVVHQVVTVPQPFGSFFDQILDTEGRLVNRSIAGAKIGILDIGTFTCDLAVADCLEYIPKLSGSKTIAMSNVWRHVRDGIKDAYGIEYEMDQVDEIVRNGQCITVEGQEKTVSALVDAAIDSLAQQVIAFARDRWGHARDFKRIILTGGGAYYIADRIKDVYPHTVVLHAPHLGNLRGFHRYAVRKFCL